MYCLVHQHTPRAAPAWHAPCSTSCPAFRLPPDLFVKHERLAFAAIKALQLGPLLDFLLRWV